MAENVQRGPLSPQAVFLVNQMDLDPGGFLHEHGGDYTRPRLGREEAAKIVPQVRAATPAMLWNGLSENDVIDAIMEARYVVRYRLAPGAVRYVPRGPGVAWSPCAVCGAPPPDSRPQPDMAAFVDTPDDGRCVIRFFAEAGGVATLDFRPHEPDWIQVKVGACERHAEFLVALFVATRSRRQIDAATVRRLLEESRAND